MQPHSSPLADSHIPRPLSMPACALLTLAAIALGAAVQVRDGLFQPVAFAWLTCAILSCACALFLNQHIAPHKTSTSRRIVHLLQHINVTRLQVLLFVGLAAQFLQLLTSRPGSGYAAAHGVAPTPLFRICLYGAAALSPLLLVRKTSKATFLVLLCLFLIMGVSWLRSNPQPFMDVWWAQQSGLEDFLHGHSPYASTYPDIYNQPESALIHNGRILAGFPYPPVTFWLDLPAYVIAHDYRYANLAAVALSALCIALTCPGRIKTPDEASSALPTIATLAAALFLFTPRIFFIIESGWTEPGVILPLTATILCAVRFPRLLPFPLGLLWASKQYMIFTVPLSLLLLPRPIHIKHAARLLLLAAATGLLVSLPLVLWDVHAFLRSNLLLATGASLRKDALSYLAYYFDKTQHEPPTWIVTWLGFTLASLTTLFALRRVARSAAGFAASIALVYLFFFTFGKFAFCNYFYFIIAALCCAVSGGAAIAASRLALASPVARPNNNLRLQDLNSGAR